MDKCGGQDRLLLAVTEHSQLAGQSALPVPAGEDLWVSVFFFFFHYLARNWDNCGGLKKIDNFLIVKPFLLLSGTRSQTSEPLSSPPCRSSCPASSSRLFSCFQIPPTTLCWCRSRFWRSFMPSSRWALKDIHNCTEIAYSNLLPHCGH